MKNTLMQTIVIAIAATAPIVALAQTQGPAPVTRAQIKSALVQLERSGYSPLGSNIDYPGDLQSAEARAGAQANDAEATTYGGKPGGSTEAGSRAAAPAKSLYLGNAGSLYVGD
ncbi:DUF4148 domain-containing protein [Trinickia sp. Y13]|uniref:DUF4148 domain-containing protein n=1 Tax=Trinickia sp. Y13 TaxID=2917807 RepID=UPI0024052E49|nr:DUF4148 domain-containing protein [Trinickia sp. Y13]MDG0027278.1 DUF4148 domain-containing protein [Trinickia sp. Y13]